MPTIDSVIAAWPGWIALAIGVILTVNKFAEESEKFANRLGRVGRYLRSRSLKRHGFDAAAAVVAEAVRVAVDVAVREARKKWEEEENEAIVALDQRLSTVSTVTAQQQVDLENMRFQYNCCLSYADYEATWHNRLSVKVASRGSMSLEDLPNHYSYYDFEKAYKTSTNWRKWAFDD